MTKPADDYSLLRDPLYYGTVAVFAVLATAVPALVGGRWFLPLAQTIALWLLALVPFRRGREPGAGRATVIVLVIWILAQLATMTAVTIWAPLRAESAMPNGFAYRAALLEWYYAGTPLPGTLPAGPLPRIVEVLGVALGSLLTGGLLGSWFLVRAINVLAYGAGVLYDASGSLGTLLGGLPLWALLRIGGYVALLATLSFVGYTGEWSPWGWPPRRRLLLWIGLGLVAAALLLEVLIA